MQILNKMIFGCSIVCVVVYYNILKLTAEQIERQNYLTTKFIRRFK